MEGKFIISTFTIFLKKLPFLMVDIIKSFCKIMYGDRYTAESEIEVPRSTPLSGIKHIDDNENEIYFVYPAKVVLFYNEVICKQTTVKHIPPGADMSVIVKLANEKIEYDIVDEANEVDEADQEEVNRLNASDLTKCK